MTHVVADVINTPRSTPLISKNVDTTQIELQRQIDKLNIKVSKGIDHEKIIARINAINEDIAKVRAEHDLEREALKTWGMAPSTWKYIGGGATLFTVVADLGAIASNIPLTVLVDNVTLSIIVSTSVTSGVGILAAGFFAAFTYGQVKVDKRLAAFDQKVRQNELLSIFLNSYQEFMNNYPEPEASKENLAEQVKELKKCVEHLKNISPSTVPQEAKDHWLSTLIQKLPDTDERKKKLVEQQEIAAVIEQRKTHPQDTSSEPLNFLVETRADQAADSSVNNTATDYLRKLYDENLKALRQEFDMDIQEMHINGYKFNADCKLKQIKKEPKESVVIDII